jgi:alanyl-tRNA synthetase
MGADKVRKKFIEFFKKSPRNHREISPAPLVPPEDPTTLLTSSGMQKLIPYLMGEPHPEGKRLVDSQPCLRLQDIEEVGNKRHLTFFEMLGNWSLGDYFKEEQLAWFWEFLTKGLNLDKERLWVSVFEGTKSVPRDEESAKIWKKLGVPKDKIFYYGAKENWWSRSGTPDEMPAGEIGGPDSEVFFDFATKHNPRFGKECHPNCQCGRFLEIGNSVFIQYKKNKGGLLEELPQKNVDFGGGLERTVAAINNDPDVFQIDLIKPIIEAIEEEMGVEYGKDEEKDRSCRIVADHIRGSVMLASEGIEPSNKKQGYVLRRLIRRSVFHSYLLNKQELSGVSLPLIADKVKHYYPEVQKNWPAISGCLDDEAKRFGKALDRGLKKLKKALAEGRKIDGKLAFDLYQTEGFPLDLTVEILKKEGKVFGKEEKNLFEEEFEKHQKLSRTASVGMFKGGLADASEEVIKLHTATHLLHAALRKVLGEHVKQKGSNITKERLRFDFSHPQKLSDDEIKKVEKLINKQIEKDLPVTFETKTLKQALNEGAVAFFGERYGEKVKVYTIGDPGAGAPPFSREVCGGPHLKHTGEIGHVRIIKQGKIGSGVIRIYAEIE